MARPRSFEHPRKFLEANEIPRIYSHSSCIGGASYYMASGVGPRVIHIVGRQRPLAHETYTSKASDKSSYEPLDRVVGYHGLVSTARSVVVNQVLDE